MENTDSANITEHFGTVTDPRKSNSRHKLMDIIAIAICSVICGAEAWEHMEDFGEAKLDWLKDFLELPHGVPSPDTFARVFAALDPEEFRHSFTSWVQAISRLTKGQVIAIDGKTLRRSHDHEAGKKAIHMVSAWACSNQIVLGQLKTEEKSNEITAIPKLLQTLAIEGCIVTIDAMGCQKDIARSIKDGGADYVLALKGNQGGFHDDAVYFFKDHLDNHTFKDVDYHETTDGGHGRVEVRRHWVSDRVQQIPGMELWEGLKTMGMVVRERHIGDAITRETSYYISSLDMDAQQFAHAVRSHWNIENNLHWVLDVTFREDESRIRKDNAPENMAVLRHMALNLLKQETSLKKSIKRKRLRAGWDYAYLEKILTG